MIKRGLNNRFNRKAQLTVFIIIALLIVTAIAIFFTLSLKKSSNYGVDITENPKAYVQFCARDAIKSAENKIIPTAGFLTPSDYILYNEIKVPWICYTPFNEQICVNKHPMLSDEIESEIIKTAKPDIEKCFDSLKKTFKDYSYEEENLQLKAQIVLNSVEVEIRKKIKITTPNYPLVLENFDVTVSSPLYDFLKIENKIVNEETLCDCTRETCNADIFKINSNNRDFSTMRFVTGKNEKIYTIEEFSSGKKFNFALRNYVRLP